MFTKTKTVLAAALVAATSTVALATPFDPNPANRHSAPAALHSVRIAATIDAGFYGYSRQLDPSGADLNDRASSPYPAAIG